MKNLYSKILAVQKAIQPIVKDETNPFFKSKYFNVDTVVEALRPIINAHGLVVMQPLSITDDGKPAILTILADPDSGESQSFLTPLIENADVQKFGGIITYTRRYALTSLFLLQGEEDDDGNKVAPKTQPSAVKPATGGNSPRCAKCGANMVHNPKTGKDFCEKKCWLNPVPVAKAIELSENLPEEETIDLNSVPF